MSRAQGTLRVSRQVRGEEMSFCIFHCTDLETIKYSEIFFPEKERVHSRRHIQRKQIAQGRDGIRDPRSN